MKKTLFTSLKEAGGVCLLVTAVVFGFSFAEKAFTPKAEATSFAVPSQTPTKVALTNLPPYVVGGGLSNITSQEITVTGSHDLTVFVRVHGTNAATIDALTLQWAETYDATGTNYSTTNYITQTVYPNGTANVLSPTTFGRTNWGNGFKVTLKRASSASASTNKTYLDEITVIP